MDDGLERLNAALHADPYLNREKRNWKRVAGDDERLEKYIARVGAITMDSFLPGRDHPELKIAIMRRPVGYGGQYAPDTRQVAFNFSREERAIQNAHAADSVIIHEYFHAIEDVIKNWSINGELKDNLPLQEMGEKFFYGGHSQLAHVSSTANYDIYRNTFRERWAYHVMRGANKKEDMYLQTRDQAWIDKHLIANDKGLPETGSLPKACAIK